MDTIDDIIEDLAGSGYRPADVSGDPTIRKTVDYYLGRGWAAARDNGGSISFVRYGEEGHHVMTTTPSGVVSSEARFTADRFGVRAFLTIANLRP